MPSFGLTILAGAILGDILWAVGPKIFASSAKVIQWVIKKVPALPPGLKDKLDVKNLQLRLGWKAKAHIVAMNLVVIVLVFLFVVILIAVFWGICNSKITYLARQSYGLEPYCKSLEGGFVDRGLNSVTGGSGQFQASYNTPGGLMGTQSWTTQINTYAQKHNIDACILRVVVQKESAGIANVIGCDCRANGRGELCLEPATTRAYYSGYKFNWNACSYGIGITQWTIFPIGGSGYKAWKDLSTPSRSIMNNWYTVNELLDPNTSLDLTAKYFGENLKKSNGDVRSAFVVYVGQSSQTERLVNDRMALYNLCKGQ